MHLSGHSWFARSGTSSLFHHQIHPRPYCHIYVLNIMHKCVSSSAHSVSPLPDRLSQLQLNVVGSVGTLPAVCDTFCLWIDPAVGRWIIRFFSLSFSLSLFSLFLSHQCLASVHLSVPVVHELSCSQGGRGLDLAECSSKPSPVRHFEPRGREHCAYHLPSEKKEKKDTNTNETVWSSQVCHFELLQSEHNI